MSAVSVRIRAALLYIFILSLAYLAGVYVGRIYYFVYLLLLFIPIASSAQLLVSLFGLRYHQEFDTEHPVKGESIGYRLTIANETLLATGPVEVRFKTIHPDLSSGLDEVALAFRGNQSVVRSYTIQCPYRGIYTVGLESLRVRDILGWLAASRAVYHRTFYVYPRIIDLTPPFSGSMRHGLTARSDAGLERDASLFESLQTYREGMDVRHMAWKKFFSTGSPFLREFGRSAQPGVSLYLDLRRDQPPSPRVLESEDCSIEITVALVKYFLDNHIRIRVRAMGMELYTFEGSEPDAFDRFYRNTINLLFKRSLSPAELFFSDRAAMETDGATLFVTHRLDSDIIDITARSRPGAVAAIINQHAMDEETRERLFAQYRALRDNGTEIYLVQGPNTIREDLTS